MILFLLILEQTNETTFPDAIIVDVFLLEQPPGALTNA
jgi:hypothetical protein